MERTGLVCLSGLFFVLCVVFGSEGWVDRCQCPSAMFTEQIPSNFSNETCCLNFSGSSLPSVSWAALRSKHNLQILDLSDCNITRIHDTAAGSTPASLRKIYLNQNQLRFLPRDFLVDAVSLEVLDLGQNVLEELPVHFLKNAEKLQVLILSGNRLQSLPASVLKLSLSQMDLLGNLWTCSCSFVKDFYSPNQGNYSRLQDIVGLNALFILLPLLLLILLTLCWCCGRKEEKKDSTNFGTVRAKNGDLSNESAKGMMRNQLMFRPSAALLGSTGDIYEEVEVKMGSVDSLGPQLSTLSGKGENQELDSKQDIETVSVSEVMRDSADREKAYMTQSTKYYSLVPGLEIEDSDHGEYENVDLS